MILAIDAQYSGDRAKVAGLEIDQAKEYIFRMHGKQRLPTLLKWVDQLCRGT